MNKELEINKDYGDIFGLAKEKQQALIFLGDNKWVAVEGDRKQEMESEKTTKNALEYINRPAINMSGTILRA